MFDSLILMMLLLDSLHLMWLLFSRLTLMRLFFDILTLLMLWFDCLTLLWLLLVGSLLCQTVEQGARITVRMLFDSLTCCCSTV